MVVLISINMQHLQPLIFAEQVDFGPEANGKKVQSVELSLVDHQKDIVFT